MNRILANPKTASFDVSKLRIRDNASIDEVNSLVENMALPNKRLKVEEQQHEGKQVLFQEPEEVVVKLKRERTEEDESEKINQEEDEDSEQQEHLSEEEDISLGIVNDDDDDRNDDPDTD